MSEMEDKKLGRYERQTMLPEIRTGGQERLRAARVLVVGTGGLGSPVSLYLAGAGIGHIGLVDDDTVSTTNLHRQVLYAEAEVGLPKVVLAARRLRALNSDVDVKPYACRLTPDNAAGMIQDYDIVVDACDNYPTRYLFERYLQGARQAIRLRCHRRVLWPSVCFLSYCGSEELSGFVSGRRGRVSVTSGF